MATPQKKPSPRKETSESESPPGPISSPVSLGVTSVRRPAASDASEPLYSSATAGEASGMFPKGGRAFAIWCESEMGINPNEKRRRSQWDDLLKQFATRPIHGYRRGSHGGSHENGRR